MKIFTLIPAFDERGNLEVLINRLENQFKIQKIQYKIFFVVQGDDGSRQLLEKLKREKPFLDFIFYEKPLGIGRAYKIGYGKIDKTADYILTMDADLNHDIKDLPKFLKSIRVTKSDLVIGSRFVTGGKFEDRRIWKKAASLVTNKLVTLLLGIPVKDISSGYRLIKREIVEKINQKLHCTGYPAYMEFILYAHKFGLKIAEVPITYHPRSWGESKINSARTFIDYIRFLGSILFNS